MPADDYRDMNAEELAEALDEAKEELFNLRFQLATNQLTNTGRIPQVKKEIARIKTVAREKELAAEEGAR